MMALHVGIGERHMQTFYISSVAIREPAVKPSPAHLAVIVRKKFELALRRLIRCIWWDMYGPLPTESAETARQATIPPKDDPKAG